jgi:hypothetical protein
MHAGQPIAGLRSFGKGANRTILNGLFRPMGRESWSFCPRGVAAPAPPVVVCALRSYMRSQGWFYRLQPRKGLET